MTEQELNQKIKELEDNIRKVELSKESHIKETNKLEVDLGILNQNIETIQKELKDVFGIDEFSEEVINASIDNLILKIKELESNNNA